MRELCLNEMEAVDGGVVVPLIVAAVAVASLTGCSGTKWSVKAEKTEGEPGKVSAEISGEF